MPDPFVMAFTGDSLIQHRISVCQQQQFLGVAQLLRGADVSFTNLEGCVQAGEDWHAFIAGGGRGATYMAVPPYCVDDLKWLGINMVSAANNHAADFCEGGVLTTMKHLKAAGLAYAGIGGTLTESTAPCYLDTPKGRVALIAASDWGRRGAGDLPYPIPMGVMAAEQGSLSKGRPGINLLRYETEITVDRATIDAMRRASEALGWEKAKAVRHKGGARDEPFIGTSPLGAEVDGEREFWWMGTKFVVGDDPTFRTVACDEDLERNYKWIREARRQADFVIVGLHQQGAARSVEEPPDHTKTFAYGAVDAGADVFVAHGHSRHGGIEVYKGKAIIFGQPALMMHNQQVTRVPQEMMSRWKLGYESTPADFLHAREVGEEGGATTTLEPNDRRGSAITLVEFDEGNRLKEIRIVPTELRREGLPRSQQGLAFLADPQGEVAQRVLERVRRRSLQYGTKVDVGNGMGIVRADDSISVAVNSRGSAR